MFKTSTTPDHIKHLKFAMQTEFDSAVDRINDNSITLRSVLNSQIEMIRKLSSDIYTNPKALADALNEIADELEDDINHI